MKLFRYFSACMASGLATAHIACANDMNTRPHPSVEALEAAEAVNDRAQERWLETQRRTLAQTEAQVKVLAQARDQLRDKKNLGIPRDAAICFLARQLMDSQINTAMRSGGEFGPALETWHDQSRGVETFCTYALTVGAPK